MICQLIHLMFPTFQLIRFSKKNIKDNLSQIKYPYQNDAPVIKSELNAKVMLQYLHFQSE